MKTLLPTLSLCAVLGLAAAGPAAAETRTYKGRTAGGYALSFKAAGDKVTKLRTIVPTTCVPTRSGTPRSGGELFEPPGVSRIGRTTKSRALQDPAMHYSEVTKNYHVTLKRKSGGRIAGKLHVNFAFQTIGYTSFGDMYLETWICRGDDTFVVR